jgi:hypothetical protein
MLSGVLAFSSVFICVHLWLIALDAAAVPRAAW